MCLEIVELVLSGYLLTNSYLKKKYYAQFCHLTNLFHYAKSS